jgi:hypothetical protein
MPAFLLVARKNGSSSSRRQRGFATMQDALNALDRWRGEGFTSWWLYGTPRLGKPRPLLRHGGEL